MSTRVRIKNFQSIEEAEIEIKGFTVITGKNNSGKSAVQRAIRGVFQNTSGNSFVRHGAKSAEVSISFDDGTTVSWEKGKNTNKYTVNGKVFDKVGSGVPDEVLALGLCPLDASGKLWSQFAPQFTGQVFLLNESGSVLAEAVSDMERVTHLNRSLRQCEKDKRSAKSTLRVRQTDQKTVSEDLAMYEGLDDVGVVLSNIEALENEKKTLVEELSQIEALRDRYSYCTSVIGELVSVVGLGLPDTSEISEVTEALSSCLELRSKYNGACQTITNLEGVSQINLPTTDELVEISDELAWLIERREAYTRAENGADKLEQMVGVLGKHLVNLHEELFKQVQRYNDGLEIIENFKFKLDLATEQIDELVGKVSHIKRELSDIDQLLKDHISHKGECPLCGSTG